MIKSDVSDNFAKRLKIRVDDKYADVKIKCENRVFKCHWLVLASFSKYFDTMFGRLSVEERQNEIPLVGIDPTTFQEVLRFIYEDHVLINDENVYNLLCASEMLQLNNDLENLCIRFLRERNIPVNYALKIFSFARAKQKYDLVLNVSRFILDNLEHFIHREEFLQMHQDEFKVLLSHFQPSIIKEFDLAWAVFCWISTSKCKYDLFMECTENVEFQSRTAEEYFNECCERDAFITKWIRSTNTNGTPLSCNKPEFLLNVFVCTDEGAQTSLFTLQKSGVDGLMVHRKLDIEGFDSMRTVSFGDNIIYSLSTEWSEREASADDNSLTFREYRSVDYPNYFRTVKLPDELDMKNIFFKSDKSYCNPESYYLCCNRNGIYLGFPNYQRQNRHLLNYDRILNQLTRLPNKDDRLIPNESMMVCGESRLYLIGFREENKSRHVLAYDCRAGKWDILCGDEIFDQNSVEGRGESCVHKGRIFSSSTSFGKNGYGSLEIGVFDPVAGKWDEDAVKPKSEISIFSGHRLLSYDGELWLFSRNVEKRLCVQKYDSFLQETSGNYSVLDDAMMSRKRGTYWLLDAVVLNSY